MPTAGSGNLTDLTNTIWYFNDYSQINFNLSNYDINFTSADGQEFKRICGSVSFGELWYTKVEGEMIYIEGGWTQYPELRTIRINNGVDIKNSTLITWLQNNATFIQHDIEIKYNNLVIASLDDTGTKTLLTAGKYCQDNIVIDYTKTGKQIYMDWALNPSGFYFDASNSSHATELAALSSIGSAAFAYRNFSGSFTFSNLTSIPSHAFCWVSDTRTNSYSCQFSFPSVTSISDYAFQSRRGLTKVIANNCIIVSSCAFSGCRDLQEIDFPSATTIGSYAFTSCHKLSTVNIPNCTTLYTDAFHYCSSLSAVDFPKIVTFAGIGAFSDCYNMQSAFFSSCTSVGGYTFARCSKLSDIRLPKCTFIGSYAFQYCSSLSQVNFSLVETVFIGTFYGCNSLLSVNLPVGSSIGMYAFQYCSNLSYVSIGSLSSIGTSAFYNCQKLASLYIGGSYVANLAAVGAFANTPFSNSTYIGGWGSIYVPSSLLSSYKTKTNWISYSARLVGY